MISRNQHRGCLLGLAAGDALGTTVEFSPPGSFDLLVDMVGGGPFCLAPGEWTDDTSMALCLAESLIEAGWSPADQIRRYVRWYREGHLSSTGRCFDIGLTTRASLQRFEQTGEPLSGPTDADTAGNGSIMRLAPIPMRYANDRNLALDRAAESSRTTHGAAVAVDGCRYLAALLIGAVTGVPKESLLASGWYTEAITPEIKAIADGSFRGRHADDLPASGYVVDTLVASLWALAQTDDFREGALLAVNLGNDADTTGAVYGQLAGALYGEAAIPPEWRDRQHSASASGPMSSSANCFQSRRSPACRCCLEFQARGS